jgi:hypothetical protein
VLLYELLTGRTPFDADALMKAGYDEMRRIIREEGTAKPSRPASSRWLRDQLSTVAKKSLLRSEAHQSACRG